MRKAVDCKPKQARYHVALGKLLFQIGETEKAEQAARHALKLEPQNFSALQSIIQQLLHREKFDEAIEFHKRQIKFHEHKTDSWASYAETLFAAERYEEAEELIDGPFRSHFQPRYAAILARSQMAQGKVKEAIATLELQIRKQPNSPTAFELLEKYQKEADF